MNLSKKYLVWLAVGLLVGVALFFRVYALESVPPGLHHDEVINAEIATAAAENGWRFFYSQGWGREGLYHRLLGISLGLELPLQWRLRLPSILAGLIGLLLTWGWVRRAFGTRVAIIAFAGIAVSFWPVALSRAALRAAFILPAAAASLWLLVPVIENGRSGERDLETSDPGKPRRRSWLEILLLILASGAMIYTYRAARVVPVILLLLLAYLYVVKRRVSYHLIVALIGVILIAAPLAVYLTTNPGLEARLAQVDEPFRELRQGNFKPILRGALDTIGMFGWRGDPENHYNLAGRPVFEPLGAIFFYIGLLIAIRRWRQPVYGLLLIWFCAGLVPGMLAVPAPHFIHTIVALPVIFVFPGIAVDSLAVWLSNRWRFVAERILPAALAIWLVGVVVWTFRDYFVVWPQQSQVRGFFQSELALIAHTLDGSPSTAPTVVCVSFLNETDPFWRSPRQTMPFMLNRTDLDLRWNDCASSQIWPQGGIETRYFFTGGAELADWVSKDWRSEARPLLFEDDGEINELVVNSQEHLVAQLASLAQTLAEQSPVNLGDKVTFLGYELSDGVASPGDNLTLITYWKLIERLPAEVSIFVHLTADSSTPLAQGDALALLSDTLLPGDIFAQHHTIALPADLPAGEYTLSTGVYSRRGDFPPLQIADSIIETGPLERLVLAKITVH